MMSLFFLRLLNKRLFVGAISVRPPLAAHQQTNILTNPVRDVRSFFLLHFLFAGGLGSVLNYILHTLSPYPNLFLQVDNNVSDVLPHLATFILTPEPYQ
jgi:hypothetical protein